jgi:hypothetical protein
LLHEFPLALDVSILEFNFPITKTDTKMVAMKIIVTALRSLDFINIYLAGFACRV